MDPPLRETMLVRGDVDAITGFTFTSLLNLEARGAKAADVVVLPYADFGVKLYGNVIIASPKLIKENPAAIKAFLSAFTKGAKDVIVVVGGVIPRQDYDMLYAAGVKGIFGPGTPIPVSAREVLDQIQKALG